MKTINGVTYFQFELSEANLNEVSAALMNHPFGKAAPVINEINRQVMAQQPRGGSLATEGARECLPDPPA
jgi:hypothetical protein